MPSNDLPQKPFADLACDVPAQDGCADQREVICAALRAEIRKGVASGPGIPAERVFAEVRAALAARSAAT
jgi:hypothetical protein